MANDLGIVNEFDTLYNEAYLAWNPFYPEAATDLRFFLGDQWDAKEKAKLFQEGRSAFVINRIRRNINLVTGYQRKNRLSSVVIPQEDEDQEAADQMTRLLLYAMNGADGYQTISDCFAGALKTGWNLAGTWMDYREDPVNGDIRISREPYNGFIVDPYFTKLDFSDCNYIMRRKYLGFEQTASLLPGYEKELKSLWKAGWARDDKFTWLPYQRQPNGQDMFAYNEMYLQKWRNVPVLVDMDTGEVTEFDLPKAEVNAFLMQYPQLMVIEKPQRYIEMHVIVNDHLIRSEINPNGVNDYPFVPFVAVFEPESDQWELKLQSLIRCMRDPQRESNRRRSQMVDILDSQINSGWIANENSVINPHSLFQSSQGKVIWRREDAAPGSLEKIPPAQIPPSMFQIQEMFDRDMTEIGGMNDAAFGTVESANDSGVMMMLRQGAAVINLQDLFDNLRASQKALSKQIIKHIQKWSPAKMKRILNQDPNPKVYDPEFVKYDIEVQEGLLTDTQKQIYFRQLVDLKNLGAPVSAEMLVQAAPIQGKSTYLKQIQEAEQQQAQQAQQQQQLQAQALDAQRQSMQAKAIADIALSKERFTRAVANNSLADERASKAVQDRSDAALNRIKAIKELQAMDDDTVIKYFNLIKGMEEMSKRDEEKIKRADIEVAAEGQQIGDQLVGMNVGQMNPQQMGQQQNNPEMGSGV